MPRSVSDAHLEESVLLRLVVGDLDPAERQGAERHLWTCSTCRDAFRASERLDAALRAAGPDLADVEDEKTVLPSADPFARRPTGRLELKAAGADAVSLAEAAARSVPEARALASRLGGAFENDDARGDALAALDLDAIRDRLALAYFLDGAFERAEQDASRLGRMAAAALQRISNEKVRPSGNEAERAVPLADLTGRALLLSGAASLFGGQFAEARTQLQAAWRAFGEGRGSEPLLARTEVFEALRRVVEGRWEEAEALATRAGETFALTGGEADAARAKLASGLAAWGTGRIRAALTLLRRSALGFRRAEAWGGFSMAACAVALCLAADGQVAESRRAFCDLRRRKARRAPLAERLFVRETERIALLLVREPAKKKGATFRFSAGDILLLRAASALGVGIVSAAREGGEKLDIALRAVDGNPARGFALLYACQKGNPFVVQDPLRGRELAHSVFDEARDIAAANLSLRAVLMAEAMVLESHAQNQLGYAKRAHVAATKARDWFRVSEDTGFGFALADYCEGSADSFAREFLSGQRLLKKALRFFAELGQDSLKGRAEASLGTLHVVRGDDVRSLPYFDRAIRTLDPVDDARHLGIIFNNRGNALARLGRLSEARASYARALRIARELGSTIHIHATRMAFAHLDFQQRRFDRALSAYMDLRNAARIAQWENEVIFASLYAAECMGFLGREDGMVELISSLRLGLKANPFASSPAIDELFACLDQTAIDIDLVAHVRKFLEDEEKGIHRPYRQLKIVG